MLWIDDVRAIKNGEATAIEVARRRGVSLRTVYSRCRRGGVSLCVARRVRVDRAAKRYRDIILEETGLDIFVRGRSADVVKMRHATMLALRRDGHTTTMIASALGMGCHTSVLHGEGRAADDPWAVKFAAELRKRA